MSKPPGRFVWYELMTSDAKAGEAFYRNVVGWGAQGAGMPGVGYTLLTVGSTPVAGMMTMPAEASVIPFLITRTRMLRRCAPSARRTPISCVC